MIVGSERHSRSPRVSVGSDGGGGERYSRSPRTSATADDSGCNGNGDTSDRDLHLAMAESARGHQQRTKEAEAEDEALQAAILSSMQLAQQPEKPDMGALISLKALEAECKPGGDASLWRAKVKAIEERYVRMRRVRGDGNCFYRSVLMGWMERLLTVSSQERAHVWTRLVPEVSRSLAPHMADEARQHELLELGKQFAKRTQKLVERGSQHLLPHLRARAGSGW